MEFRVLGPLEVVDGTRAVALGGPRLRSLLACLLVYANEVVPGERLLEELWGSGSTATAGSLQVSVSRLRKALGDPDRLATSPSGYVLRLSPEECDRDVFEGLVTEGRRLLEQAQAEPAAATLRRALALWRGPPFVDFVYEPFAQAEIARLEEARLACLEERIEADLALGRHAELVGELEALTREHPLRERPRGQLMLALYRRVARPTRSSSTASTRELFAEELGIEPGPALRRIEAAILRQDAELELPTAPTAVESGEAQVLGPSPFSAPGGPQDGHRSRDRLPAGESAALDPELRRGLGDGALAELAPVLERHGGNGRAAAGRSRDGGLRRAGCSRGRRPRAPSGRRSSCAMPSPAEPEHGSHRDRFRGGADRRRRRAGAACHRQGCRCRRVPAAGKRRRRDPRR